MVMLYVVEMKSYPPRHSFSKHEMGWHKNFLSRTSCASLSRRCCPIAPMRDTPSLLILAGDPRHLYL
jgi:hypothetical protein